MSMRDFGFSSVKFIFACYSFDVTVFKAVVSVHYVNVLLLIFFNEFILFLNEPFSSESQEMRSYWIHSLVSFSHKCSMVIYFRPISILVEHERYWIADEVNVAVLLKYWVRFDFLEQM